MSNLFFTLLFSSCSLLNAADSISPKIDRKILVHRHFPSVTKFDSLSPFTVGNGEFAFTVDATGLQTFPHYYNNGIPLGTQSQWGWHSIPNTKNFTLDQTFAYYNTYGRSVPYASQQHSEAGQWLRANPHRLHLGRIGFSIMKANGVEIQQSDITNIFQSLNLWEGYIKSSFSIENDEFNVATACHPEIDQIAVKVNSKLLVTKRVGIRFDFSYGSLSWGKNSADWNSPEKHSSIIVFRKSNSILIKRVLDSTNYYVHIHWKGKAECSQPDKHSFILNILEKEKFEFVCHFAEQKSEKPLPDAGRTFSASAAYWKKFWQTGGAIDLSESTDSRAHELERRIILSRYLTAIQCAGSLPPQETGLTFNSWYGKFHLEMHWWHAVQFALWGKPELLEKSLWWYKKILPAAKQTAALQGYTGARFPKMVAYDGRESPSTIGPFLIWQQPHPIYYAELLYRLRKNDTVLKQYKNIVFEAAEFMASYAQWDSINMRYVLGPPLIPAQEIHKPDSTMNPAFELSYWKYGLKTAQQWRERLGLSRNKQWDNVLKNLSALPLKNGLYQNAETALNTFEDSVQRNDHPALLGAYGMLPNDSVDCEAMRRTLHAVLQTWNWETTWGWDFPLIAMTAARLDEPEKAIDALLMNVQKNTYLNNGHNFQDNNLTIYLPGNGGLLAAVAMMAAGWDGAPHVHAPGFPKDGKWVVKFEGLERMP